MSTSEPEAAQPAVLPVFARHETFHPRYGWLKKGFDAASDDADIFNAADATTRLGVGKNMVRAIRYWCVAFKVLEERPSPSNPRLLALHPTPFGNRLLTQWDPYLEDPGSLWLLHWNLLKAPCRAAAWWALLHRPRPGDFTDLSLLEDLRRFCEERPEWEIADSSLVKDVRCLLRMYADTTQGRDLLEDSIDSPFVELELIRPVAGPRRTRHYVLNREPKPGLPDAIVAHACLDYLSDRGATGALPTVTGLAAAPAGPGAAFALSEPMLTAALERFVSEHPGVFDMTYADGIAQLRLPTLAEETVLSPLDLHFDEAVVTA